KSRGGGPIPPIQAIETYSADGVRYWAASTGFGKDAIIDEEKMQNGQRLVTKLWNVARFSARFLEAYTPTADLPDLTPADRWLLARLHELIQRVTQAFEAYEYAAAKSEVENFFWKDLADNYLEMAKQRLYNPAHPQYTAARYTLYHTLLGTLKLFAPFLPFVTEELYLNLFAETDGAPSIHTSHWPQATPTWDDENAIELGAQLVEIATAVRRYKSENSLSLGTEIHRLQLALGDAQLAAGFEAASGDLMSVTCCLTVEVGPALDEKLIAVPVNDTVRAAIELAPAGE
ncbi:MAG: class I tRNA ligase family protein, partial [Anaerolineales bacterium]|nr:class I tRNA ligase family protein [Anaerolineales bacterium]